MANKTAKLISQNTWIAKFLRFFTSFLPVSKNRRGSCSRCGACCKLPNVCPFFATDKEGLAICKIYPIRPLSCRKYPRTESEHLTKKTCTFTFNNPDSNQ